MNIYINKLKRLNFKDLMFYTVVCILCLFILCKPKLSADGAKKGIIFCVDVLVPALFPFMAASSFIVNTGTAEKLSPFFSKVTNKLFRLPGCTGSTILLSLIGGYPTGARGIKTLLKNQSITQEQAQRMIMFCVGAGPAFVISAIGVSMLNNIYIGIALLFSQIISSIILGIIVSRLSNDVSKDTLNPTKNKMTFSQSLVVSCDDAAKGIISICAFVVLFSSFLSIIETSVLYSQVLSILKILELPDYLQNTILPIVFEITGASYKLVHFHAPIEVLAFSLGFGGLAVHFQIFSSVGELDFSKFKFLFFRLIHGLISAIIVHFLIYFIPAKQTLAVFSFNKSRLICHSISPSSLALIILCCCFVITISPKTISFSSLKKRGFLNENRRNKRFKKICKEKVVK